MMYDWSMESNHTTLILYLVYFAKRNLNCGDFEKRRIPKPARIPPQTPPAGGKSAEAGQIQNPRKIVCPASSALFPFYSLGFSAKWVLTFSNKHHHSEFVKEVASGLRPSALVSAKKFQGVLNSAERIPAESRRFPNKVWIVPKAQEPMNRDFKIVGVMQNLLSI
jgi:hypothetical protein